MRAAVLALAALPGAALTGTAHAGDAERRLVERFVAECYAVAPDVAALSASAAAGGPGRLKRVYVADPGQPGERSYTLDSDGVACAIEQQGLDPDAVRREAIAALSLGGATLAEDSPVHSVTSWPTARPGTQVFLSEMRLPSGTSVNLAAYHEVR